MKLHDNYFANMNIMTFNKLLLFVAAMNLNHVHGFHAFSRSNLEGRLFSHLRLSSAKVNERKITADGVYVVNQMPPDLPSLRNTYFLLRHGQSWGNVEGVISSARSLATSKKHGLTPLGYDQGKRSAADLLKAIKEKDDLNFNDTELFFYSSPFARARQTAEACLDGLMEELSFEEYSNLAIERDIRVEDGIMERFFGRLDDEAIHTYAYVWPVDMFDVTHTAFEVESVAAVSTRLRETILRIEENHEKGGDIIVLVSHADVLQILQMYAANPSNVGMFSSYRFANGEVRELGRTPESLPDPQPLQPPKIGT